MLDALSEDGKFPRLQAIIISLEYGTSSGLWVCIFMIIVNYILACIGMLEFMVNDPFHFGSLRKGQ